MFPSCHKQMRNILSKIAPNMSLRNFSVIKIKIKIAPKMNAIYYWRIQQLIITPCMRTYMFIEAIEK